MIGGSMRGIDKEQLHRIEALSPARRAWLESRLAGMIPGSNPARIASALKDGGIARVYHVPGTPMYPTLAACRAAGMELLMARHQSSAVMMSLSDSFLNGSIESVVMVSPGPGATNATTGILVARDNCWPLLVLGGGRPPQDDIHGTFQELESVRLFQPLTKWAGRVAHGDHLGEMIAHGLKVAVAGKPGPVYLEMPEQVLLGQGKESPALELPLLPFPPAIDAADVSRCLDVLKQARRPLLMLGKGTRWTMSSTKLRTLVDLLGLPFITGPMAWGLIPDDHPLCFDRVSHHAQEHADVVLQVGLRQNWCNRFGSALGPDARIVRVNVDDTGHDFNRRTWLNIHGDAGEFMAALCDRVDPETAQVARQRMDGPWLQRLQQRRDRKRQSIDRKARADQSPVSPYRLAAAVNEFAADRMFCVYDGNVAMAAAQQVIRSRHPWRRMNAGTNGCIGSGIPFAIGAAMADRSTRVLVLCGDTGFGIGIMELETAMRAGLRLIVVVANNDGVTGRLPQETYFPADAAYMTTFTSGLRYDRMITAIGGHGEYVEDAETLLPALQRAEEAAVVSCVNVRVDGHVPHPGN
jgi:2-hydroxyacyl-CoA lyase 1